MIAQPPSTDTWQEVRCRACDRFLCRIRFGLVEIKCKCGKVNVIQRQQ